MIRRMNLFLKRHVLALLVVLASGCGERTDATGTVGSAGVHIGDRENGSPDDCAAAAALSALRYVAPEPWMRVSPRDFDIGRRTASGSTVDKELIHLYTLDVYRDLGFRGRIVHADLSAVSEALNRGRTVLLTLERPNGMKGCAAVLARDEAEGTWRVSDPTRSNLESWSNEVLEGQLSKQPLAHFEVWWEDPWNGRSTDAGVPGSP